MQAYSLDLRQRIAQACAEPGARQAQVPGSQRVGQGVPLKRGRSLPLIGVLSVRGLQAMQVLEGALTQRSFALYIAVTFWARNCVAAMC